MLAFLDAGAGFWFGFGWAGNLVMVCLVFRAGLCSVLYIGLS